MTEHNPPAGNDPTRPDFSGFAARLRALADRLEQLPQDSFDRAYGPHEKYLGGGWSAQRSFGRMLDVMEADVDDLDDGSRP